MSLDKNKLLLLFSVLLILTVVMPVSFAGDNDTILSIDDSDVLSLSDYYFDANAVDDNGDGSESNPYKTLNSTRLKSNATLHFADGKYDFEDYVSAANVTFIGADKDKTVISNLNIDLKPESTLTLTGITLIGASVYGEGNITLDSIVLNSSSVSSYNRLDISNVDLISSSVYSNGEMTAESIKAISDSSVSISGKMNLADANFDSSDFSSSGIGNVKDTVFKNTVVYINNALTAINVTFESRYVNVYGNLTANNCIFRNSKNSNGGMINANSKLIVLSNCTFENNYATSSGGAIYITRGVLNISGCSFINNTASNWGGVISAENTDVIIKNSKFLKNYALNDVGGAIYLKKSSLTSDSLNITTSSSTFGGAITALISNITLNSFYARDNKAKYDGGAVYNYGGNITITNSQFESNNARNGGALFIDNAKKVVVTGNKFIKNVASQIAGTVYSIISNTTKDEISNKNTFTSNKAGSNANVYFSDSISLEIGDGNYTFINFTYTDSELPSSYRSPYVTSVKNQGSGGNCWAFTAAATLESAIKKATGKDLDLSENNMKNIMSLYSDYGWQMETNKGGYDDMGTGYLTAWLGPVLESDDGYNPQSVLSPRMDALYHVQNILFLQRNNQTDTEVIKEAVYRYGAVGTCIYWSGSYNKNGNYYYTGSESVNHAVTIIGWDDNYSKDNFKTKPEGDGAWIIKNSWGTGSGDKGFFYVSYYDTRIAYSVKTDATFAFILDDAMKYDKNYQYDIPGRTDYMLDDGDMVWYKNKFTATDDEYLSAVSTYFEYPTNWTVSVYVNNDFKLSQSGNSPASYSTISLDKLIPLKKGDSFEVVFNVTNGRGVTSFPISEIVSLNYEFYTPGISYMSKDGKEWRDIYEYAYSYSSHTYTSQVACIKAFTIFDKLKTSTSVNVSFNSLNTVDLTAVVHDQYGNVVGQGEVTFTIDKTTVKADIKDGVARYTYAFKNSGQDTVRASFSGDGYISSSAEAKFNMTGIVSNDVTRYYDNVVFDITLQDANGKAIANKKILFSVNEANYTATTNSNGKAFLKLSLPIGEYTIVTKFAGDRNYMNCEVSNVITAISTITLPSQVNYTYNAPYSVLLTDLEGNALTGTNVNVKIGDNSYTVKTNSNGQLSTPIQLEKGNYMVSVKNPKTGEVKTQNITVLDRIVENNKLTMYYKAGKSYSVRVLDDEGNPLKGAKVTFTINKKTYTRTSDADGYAALTINLKPGSYTITASYNGFKVSNKVVVKTTIITKNINVKKGKTIKFTAKILNTKGKIVKKKKVTFKFKGKTYKVKTNSKGIATLKITKKYKAGKYTISTSYNGLKVKNKIKIKK